jgi:quinol monooxygenase YgiN
MVILKVTLNALPDKRRELEQTLLSMVTRIRKVVGCEEAEGYRDLKNENRFFVLSQWEFREKLDAYLRSDKFSALMGTRILLSAPPSVSIDAVSSREGMQAIAKARSASQGG